jgi:hypothetical protein
VEFSNDVVKAAWDRQGGRCAKCGRWLIWKSRDRHGGTGAWRPHPLTPEGQGGNAGVANCVIFCSGIADCHLNIGHGGLERSVGEPLDASTFLFFDDAEQVAKTTPEPTKKRSLAREVFGIRRSTKVHRSPDQKRKPQTVAQS